MKNTIAEPANETTIRRPSEAPEFGRPMNGVGESVHRFGPGLVGILHRPPSALSPPAAVILMNAGLVHRIGPFRGYVTLARELAARGFAVLRFDQGGLGDSEVSKLGSLERRRVEITAAMDLLASEADSELFVLGGICSGADDAFLLAGLEPRISGLILLDGLAYRTPGFWWRHLRSKLRVRGRWHRLLRQHWWPATDVYREHPPQAEAVQQLQRLLERDVRLLFVYTGGSNHYFNHPGQLRACLGDAAAAPQVTVELWRDCDHTFYLRHDRQRLQQRLVSWMHSEFGSAGRALSPGEGDGP